MRSYNIGRGEQTISFAASTVDGESAVTLTALGGQQMGLLRSGAMGDDRAPVAFGTAQAVAGGVAVTTGLATFLYVRRRRNEQDVRIRREL
jgi:outer membrane lipoprotein SlyB